MSPRVIELRKKNDEIIREFLKDPNYIVRKDGTIFTRISPQGHVQKKFRPIGSMAKDGHSYISYCKNRNMKKLSVRRIVYQAHCGELDACLNVTYKDGDRTNNKPDNLIQCTPAESLLQRFGVYGHPPVVGNHKKEMKEKARQLRYNGLSVKEIERELGVARSSISVWVRDIKLTPEQELRIKRKISANGGFKG